MKSTPLHLALGGLLALGLAAPVVAEEEHSISGNLAFATDYIFRGFSQTDNGPAIQGGLTYTYNPASIYVGTWASNVDKSGFADAGYEVDFYGGWRPSFGDFTLDAGATYYMYPNSSPSQDTLEFKLGGSYDFGVVAPSLTGYYSDDWFNTGDAWRVEVGATVPLPADFALTAKFGWNQFDDLEDYEDWSLGLTYSIGGATLGLTYVDTSGLSSCPAPFRCDATVVGSVLLSF